jgi:membrane dipeptidase
MMRWSGRTVGAGIVMATTVAGLVAQGQEAPPKVSDQARAILASGLLIDGHNDLPWEIRKKSSDFAKYDIAKRLDFGHTDIPRLREGGLKAQFWSVWIPGTHDNPARTVLEQIDLVHRMIAQYPDDFALALSADDIERATKEGKIAGLIGMEGGVAIENSLAVLRDFYRLGVRYMTLTHNETIDWADAATDDAKHDGLTAFGEQVVREMNRLGMLVDISHVSPATMADVMRVTKAPVIASHSNAKALCPSPRNVPDEILALLPANGGVVMVNFYSAFVDGPTALKVIEARKAARAANPDPAAYRKAMSKWFDENPTPSATVFQLADHIDHIVKVAGIDHVGIGSDFDGIDSAPVGLEDVSKYPVLVQVLLDRGYSESDIHKVLGGNVLRAFRKAGAVAAELQKTTRPELDAPAVEPKS